MNSIYTTIITRLAEKRGIEVEVHDPHLPVFSLRHGGVGIRCFNALTDKVGAATFHLAQDKGAANRFLRSRGIPVPAQHLFAEFNVAAAFMADLGEVVVKPIDQWGGRGVSTGVSTPAELRAALRLARHFSEDVVLEECVSGIDWRLIYVAGRFVAAIQRNPATVEGNGRDTIRSLIRKQNQTAQGIDPGHRIPMDSETQRCLASRGRQYQSVPALGEVVQVRRTTNYHTGGSVEIVTDLIPRPLIDAGLEVASLLEIPVLGVDMLVNPKTHQSRVIELSPDLAISPPEGEVVAEAFLDFLFPKTKSGGHAVKRGVPAWELVEAPQLAEAQAGRK
jgi:D-alanine-D-alanine ligase-like ATP-grasp enzyme